MANESVAAECLRFSISQDPSILLARVTAPCSDHRCPPSDFPAAFAITALWTPYSTLSLLTMSLTPTQVMDSEEQEWIAQSCQLTNPPAPTETTSQLGHGRKTPCVFARLLPNNVAALKAFHEIVQAKNDGKLSSHHAQFLRLGQVGCKILSNDAIIVQCLSDSDAEVEDLSRSPSTPFLRGHFEIRLEDSLTGTGWRVGKGTSKVPEDRNVDILLLPPPDSRSQEVQQSANKTASVNFLIGMNPASGALRLIGACDKRPLGYEPSSIKLRHNESRVLHQRHAHLTLADLEYCFQYSIDVGSVPLYIEQRNDLLEQSSPRHDLPHPKLPPVPPSTTKEIANTFQYDSLAAGAFGMVSLGVVITTGDPVAIKELQIKNSRTRNDADQEASIAREFGHVSRLKTYIMIFTHATASNWLCSSHCDSVRARTHIALQQSGKVLHYN